MFKLDKVPQGGEEGVDNSEQIQAPENENENQEQIEKLKEEERDLNKLQFNGKIGDQEWDRDVHFPRLNEIKDKLKKLEQKGEALSEQERESLRELRMKQAGAGDGEWTNDDREKLLKLQDREDLE